MTGTLPSALIGGVPTMLFFTGQSTIFLQSGDQVLGTDTGSQQPPPELQQLFAALRGNQAETNRFFGTLAGTVPIPEFFAPENLQRIIGAAHMYQGAV